MKKKYLIWLMIIWTSIVTGSFIFNYSSTISSNNNLVLNESRGLFEQIISTREWNSTHNGVYVPITAETPPNPYLEDSLRDVVTMNGMALTKINPAYMTRQISEINKKYFGIQFHITSLNPIRLANKADAWEAKGLKSFEDGTPEVIELVKEDTISRYRYMAPLVTQKSCLNCHAKQGYEVGDIRGGISVSIPSARFLSVVNKQILMLFFLHFIILVLGIITMLLFYRKLNRYIQIIKEKNRDLENLNATKDKLFSVIAHDLRSPFNGILGLSDLLIENIDNYDSAESKECLKSINTSAHNTLNLLENLLSWAKSQTGQMVFNPSVMNLQQVLSLTVETLQVTAKVKNITLNYKEANDIEIYADQNMIITVLHNLISNAIKYTAVNGIVNIEVVSDQSQVAVTISDNGVGMNRKTIDEMFEMGATVSMPGTANEKGTGLGLILCKEFIEKHGGKISVESQIGVGSKFKFTLPLKKTE